MSRRPAAFLRILAVASAISVEAQACRTSDFHHHILLEKLIPDVEPSPIIAKVVVLEIRRKWNVPHDFEEITADARVIEAVKGSEVGQIVPIMANPDSCLGGLDEGDVGKQGYIAGRMFEDRFVSGRWTNRILKKYRD